jgi:hypothetical protein
LYLAVGREEDSGMISNNLSFIFKYFLKFLFASFYFDK